MNLCEILAINLKYYRKKYNLSQEEFAKNINIYDKQSKIKSEDLVTYKKEHLTNFLRIDEKKE